MPKIVVILCIFVFGLFATQRHVDISPALIESGIKVVDIRTPPEWSETGVVKGAILITFFDEQGRYDAQAFLQKLDRYVAKGEPFAIVCRTGSRTKVVADFLSKQGYEVTNLKGGMKLLLSQGYAPSKPVAP